MMILNVISWKQGYFGRRDKKGLDGLNTVKPKTFESVYLVES